MFSMRERLIIICLFFNVTLFSTYAGDTLSVPLNASLEAQAVSSNLKSVLRDSYQVRPLKQDDFSQLNKWYVDVNLVDGENNKISDHTYRVSRRYYNKAVSVRINGSMQGIDKNKKTLTFPSDSRYVMIGENDQGWEGYNLIRVDKNGYPIDLDGNIIKKNIDDHVFKISRVIFDNEVFETQILNLTRMDHEIEEVVEAPKVDCPPTVTTSAPTTSVRPKIRPTPKPTPVPVPAVRPKLRPTPKPAAQVGWKENCRKLGTWGCLEANLRSWKRSGYNACYKRVAKHEKEFNKLWSEDSLSTKAKKVRSGFSKSLEMIKAHGVSIGQGGKRKSNYGNVQNPYYIDPLVTSDVASCLAFQETHGTLSPQKVNYAICNKKGWSTAIGLGQTTRSTIRGLRSSDGKNLLPITTLPGSPFKGKTGTYIHSKLADNPSLQYEVILRMFNYKLKFARWQVAAYKNKKCNYKSTKSQNNCLALKKKLAGIKTEKDMLARAVEMYDQDNKSSYLKNVMNKCLPCMQKLKAGGNAKSCHDSMTN